KPEVAEACTSGLRLAIYVISSSNKRRNNYLRLRCSVTICQRSCGALDGPEVRRLILTNDTSEFRWVSPTGGNWRNKFKRRSEDGNEGWMTAEVVWLAFAGSLRHLNLLRTREREHSRGNVLSLQQMPRGTRRRMKESEAQNTGGLHRKSSSKCSKHWMNISTRRGVSTSHSNANASETHEHVGRFWLRKHAKRTNIVNLFEGNSLYKAHFTRGSGTSAVVHE
ncbi:MAG: hypothetical protein ACTS5A_03470, partial [Candidatus Hodgkinia cicadicola]